jgi:hypothetical protein
MSQKNDSLQRKKHGMMRCEAEGVQNAAGFSGSTEWGVRAGGSNDAR